MFLQDLAAPNSISRALATETSDFPGNSFCGPPRTFVGNADLPTTILEKEGGQLPLPDGALQVGYLPGGSRVLPGTRNKVTLPLPQDLEPGKYVLELNGALGEEPLVRDRPVRDCRHLIPPPPTVAGGNGG